MIEALTLTYQTRIPQDERCSNILRECALLLSTVERSLYKEASTGKTPSSCKNGFLKKYGITARQFNAVRVSLEGKVAACKSGQEQAIASLKQKIETLNKQIQRLEKKSSKRFTLHQKKRRNNSLSTRLANLEKDQKEKRVHLCFGGKKLFRSQFYLEKNGFSSHQEWKKTWEAKRNSEFFILGSKDETAGNQTCQACLQEDGKLSFRLRLPDALAQEHGKYLEIEDVSFAYGNDAILASLAENRSLSYRFKNDEKGWTLFVSTDLKKPDHITLEGNGVIGIDLNTDHIACIETDRFGNPIEKKVIPWNSYGKTNEQLKAITGDICKQIVEWAKETKKPLVIEKLDFKKKKLTLGNENKFSRLLSSFAYRLFFVFLTSRAFKNGIALHQVNPAYSSLIGRVNYATRYGLSVHLAAALCIARRHQKFSEAPCSPTRKIPNGKGGHVAFVLPVRNRAKHVWHFWAQVNRKLKAAHVAHHQATPYRSSSPNSTPETVPS